MNFEVLAFKGTKKPETSGKHLNWRKKENEKSTQSILIRRNQTRRISLKTPFKALSPKGKSLTKGTEETLVATYTASHLFAEKSKWTAWSSNSDFPWRYESMDSPMVVVLSKTKPNKRKVQEIASMEQDSEINSQRLYHHFLSPSGFFF